LSSSGNRLIFGSEGTDIVGHKVRSSNPAAFENANPLSEGVDLLLSAYSGWRCAVTAWAAVCSRSAISCRTAVAVARATVPSRTVIAVTGTAIPTRSTIAVTRTAVSTRAAIAVAWTAESSWSAVARATPGTVFVVVAVASASHPF
jgi:hypothetical protein